MFQKTALPIFDSVLQGYNGCIITYGQSGSGKTHTIMGKTKDTEQMGTYSDYEGLLPRTFHYLFETLAQPKYEHIDITIKIFLIEIYNDKIYDLLVNSHPELKVKGNGSQSDSFYIKDVTEIHVSSLQEAKYFIEICQNSIRRSGVEAQGGKSHFIFNLTVIQENLITKISKIGEISFVDLVACERISDSRSMMHDQTMAENKSINKGLSHLALCIENMSKGLKGDFRVLHKYVDGNSMTAFILTCNSEVSSLQETLSTLKFGQCAKKLKNKVKLNRELSFEMLRSIIVELEARISYYQRKEQEEEEKNWRLRRSQVDLAGIGDNLLDKSELVPEDEGKEEVWHELKQQFERVSEERDMLRAELEDLIQVSAEEAGHAKRVVMEQGDKYDSLLKQVLSLEQENITLSRKVADLEGNEAREAYRSEALQLQLQARESENQSLQSRIRDLEAQVATKQQETDNEQQKHDISDDGSEVFNKETRSLIEQHIQQLQTTITRLSNDLARKSDWAKVLQEHIEMKNRVIRHLKNEFSTVKFDNEKRIDSLATRMDALIEEKSRINKMIMAAIGKKNSVNGLEGLGNEDEQFCQESPERVDLPSLRNRELFAKSIASLDIIKKSEILYKSIDRTVGWAGRLQALRQSVNESKKGRLEDIYEAEDPLVREQTQRTAAPALNLRQSGDQGLFRLSANSKHKASTIKKFRGGTNVKQFNPSVEERAKPQLLLDQSPSPRRDREY